MEMARVIPNPLSKIKRKISCSILFSSSAPFFFVIQATSGQAPTTLDNDPSTIIWDSLSLTTNSGRITARDYDLIARTVDSYHITPSISGPATLVVQQQPTIVVEPETIAAEPCLASLLSLLLLLLILFLLLILLLVLLLLLLSSFYSSIVLNLPAIVAKPEPIAAAPFLSLSLLLL